MCPTTYVYLYNFAASTKLKLESLLQQRKLHDTTTTLATYQITISIENEK